MEIFGNTLKKSQARKAVKGRMKFEKKFNYNENEEFATSAVENDILASHIGLDSIVIDDRGKPLSKSKSVIVGTIRMGYGHYRIGMALASAAHSMGIKPYWLDLLSFEDSTATKIINHLNALYSLGSRLSQKIYLFNKFYWEPMTAEGFKSLAFNAGDHEMCKLMAPLYKNIPNNIPVVGAHAWASIAAMHAGMNRVVNVIADNWPLGLHLCEGSIHTIQSPSAYMGYRTLKNMDRNKKTLNPMPADDIVFTGHYVDHELVSNIDADCKKRISRMKKKQPRRLLISVGGAGAQSDLIKEIITRNSGKIISGEIILYINAGDHKNVYDLLNNHAVKNGIEPVGHTDWEEIQKFTQGLLKKDAPGLHLFTCENIFSAVYTTNLLMRATDIMITKPSELAYYPVPKLMIQRVGGHEMWGAIRSSELGDGTIECETEELTLQALDLMTEEDDLFTMQCEAIMAQHKIGMYNGAYRVIELAMKKK